MSAAVPLTAVPDLPVIAEETGSRFAELMEQTHQPYRFSRGLEVPAPDDRQVAELDDAGSALDDLDILTGSQYEAVLDEIDDLGRPPAAAAEDLLAHFHLSVTPVDGWLDLVEKVNVYGRDIDYDLWERGHDLRDYFTGRWPWDHLLHTVLPRLPMGSSYDAAVKNDDELAARIAAVHGPPSKRPKGSARPPLRGWTREVAYQHSIDSRLEYLQWAVFAAQAQKKRGSPPKARKGPETADDRYEQLDFMREHEEIVSQVLKRKGGSTVRRLPGMPAPEAVRGAVLLDPPDPG